MRFYIFILFTVFLNIEVSADENTLKVKESKNNKILLAASDRDKITEEKENKISEDINNTEDPDSNTQPEIIKGILETSEILVGVTGVVQSSTGADTNVNIEGNVTDGTMSTDLEIITPFNKKSNIYIHFESGGGEGINNEIPTLTGINGDADDDENFRITELWYETLYINEKLRFRFGKVDLTTDFDTNNVANSEIDQFLSTGFVNNSSVEFPDDNGFGAMLWFSQSEKLNIGIGIGDSDADWENVFNNLFSILELDYMIKPGGKTGNYRFYGWINKKDHEKIINPAEKREDAYGFGLSLDQEITESVKIFGRYGRCREDIFQTSDLWSAGIQTDCGAIGRDGDVFGIAYSFAGIGKSWKFKEKFNGIISHDENHIEAYYSHKINENLNISPDFQWIQNPSGIKTSNDIFIFGIRSQLTF